MKIRVIPKHKKDKQVAKVVEEVLNYWWAQETPKSRKLKEICRKITEDKKWKSK